MHPYDRHTRASTVAAWDTLGLGLVLAVLLAISVANLTASPHWELDASPAPWCAAGEVPTFHLGFRVLANAIGSVMGVPTQCEHGDDSSGDTLQATTTGIAMYDPCTNTPSFTRGQDHWMLTPDGVEHWTGGADSPSPLPVVRVPDLRHLCPT